MSDPIVPILMAVITNIISRLKYDTKKVKKVTELKISNKVTFRVILLIEMLE